MTDGDRPILTQLLHRTMAIVDRLHHLATFEEAATLEIELIALEHELAATADRLMAARFQTPCVQSAPLSTRDHGVPVHRYQADGRPANEGAARVLGRPALSGQMRGRPQLTPGGSR